MSASHPGWLTRRQAFGACAAIGAAAAGTGLAHQSRRIEVLLESQTVAFSTADRRELVPVGQVDRLAPGTRVLTGSPQTQALVAAEREWIAGCAGWTHRSDEFSDVLDSALRDLRVLSVGLPATVAGWTPLWRYVWPRDASFAAVALGLVGQHDMAWRQLHFLARAHPGTGRFQARYSPYTTRTPDGRSPQLDGSGWVLWAVDSLATSKGGVPSNILGLARRSAECLLDEVDPGSGLPAVSPDYWEIPEDRLTLGTAGVTALGLHHAGRLFRGRDDALSRTASSAADRTLDGIHSRFGPSGYARYADGGAMDAAVTFLLPPYWPGEADPRVVTALDDAERRMSRPAGGLAPGAGWKNDGISWTPETALFALSQASIGRLDRARTWLGWLADHRTAAGSFPEKVLHDGQPAAVAPLAWTAALVIATVHRLRVSSGS